jgi:hypothetical protein
MNEQHEEEPPDLDEVTWRGACRLNDVASRNTDDAINQIVESVNAAAGSLRPRAARTLSDAVKMLVRRIGEERLAQLHLTQTALRERAHLVDLASAKQMTGDQFAAIMLRDLKNKEG